MRNVIQYSEKILAALMVAGFVVLVGAAFWESSAPKPAATSSSWQATVNSSAPALRPIVGLRRGWLLMLLPP
jgi:hypothetical protein